MNMTTKPASVIALCVSAALVGAVPAARPADAPTPPPPPAPPAASVEHSDLDAQLEAARRRLEQAANEVARLSTQISATTMEHMSPLLEPGHAIIGVQLESAATGARVREVSPGGPAAEAGIRTGDVIVAVNGTTITNTEPARQVMRLMREVKPDSRLNLRVLRDGKPRDFTLTVRSGPIFYNFSGFAGAELPDLEAFMLHRPLQDMELATLSPQLGGYFGSDRGVLVVRAPADGALGLEDGDVILSIDGRVPTSGSHATRILGSYQPGEKVKLRILRQHKAREIEVTLPERTTPLHKQMMHRAGPAPVAPQRQLVIFGRDAA